MKKLLIATAAAVALATAGTAGAADLPVKAPPMVAPPVVYNWTGCYIGAGAGYGMWNQDVNAETFAPLPPFASATTTVGGRGWFGTVQGGCDYQFNGPWLVGVFADGDWGNIHRVVEPFSGLLPIAADEKQKSAWSVGGRIGYLPFPKLLTFISGGWTQAHFDSMNFQSTIPGVVIPATIAITAPSQDYNGWFIGGGYEYGFDWAPGLFWKTEYRFSQYQARDIELLVSAPVINVANLATGIGFHSEKFEQVVRTELVWRFNFGGPVVARY
jgi:outer membrane immunogenic protein